MTTIQERAKGVQYAAFCKECGNLLTRRDAIMGNIILAVGELWHRDHFKCAVCSVLLCNRTYYTQASKIARCLDCHMQEFNPRCHGCEKPLFEVCVEAMGAQWHRDCFKCRVCRNPVQYGRFVEHEGFAYDEDCYYTTVKGLDPLKPI